MADIASEIKRRRTFAIISHPDAGKTTLTEKFLLYGGAINLAGSVKGKANSKYAVSDWMELPPCCSLIMMVFVSTSWTHRVIRTSQRIRTVR